MLQLYCLVIFIMLESVIVRAIGADNSTIGHCMVYSAYILLAFNIELFKMEISNE